MTIQFLHEAETDLAELAGLPGEIRTKVKAGLAELKRLRDAIDATIATLTGGAQATLASLQNLAAQGPSADMPPAADGADAAGAEPAAGRAGA